MEIYRLKKLPKEKYDQVGGKARGLAILAKKGFPIPDGLVLLNVTEKDVKNNISLLVSNYRLYGNYAVRSSAFSEDGESFSSAGQYETVLNVKGGKAIRDAIKTCVASLHSERANKYNDEFNKNGKNNNYMNIVIQEMVDAAYSGVCFTRNPITRSSRILISVVEGLGESLVSGTAASNDYEVDFRNNIFGKGPLSDKKVLKIAKEVRKAKDVFGSELDLEYSINKKGRLMFLQARPITTLNKVDTHELDNDFYNSNEDVFSTYNIGEMLPGAVTPLSISTSVMSIDYGLRKMLMSAGAYRNLDDVPAGSCITPYSNHLFLNLTTIFKMGYSIVGAKTEQVQLAICGKRLEDLPPDPWKRQFILRRLGHMINYMKFMLGGKKALKQIDRLLNKYKPPLSNDMKEQYELINEMIPVMNEISLYHFRASSFSGAMSTGLTFILEPKAGHDEAEIAIAKLLQNIDNIESVQMLKDMKNLAKVIYLAHSNALDLSDEELLNIILNDQGEIKKVYDAFIERHGHRAIREAELRSKSWKEDLKGLVNNLKTIISSGLKEDAPSDFDLEATKAEIVKQYGVNKKAIDFLTKASREGVYGREYTKSRLVKGIELVKIPYQNLAKLLVEAGILPEIDLIYFFKHEEVGELIKNKDLSLVDRAIKRRELLEEQKELRFKPVNIGIPEPIMTENIEVTEGSVLSGSPISKGYVKGKVRIIRNSEEAKLLKPGEIMVCRFTDIGWSPYYTIAGGMITEIGSALSHGAVVAREYNLPLVVNIDNATRIFKDGDMIILDANKGIVTLIA